MAIPSAVLSGTGNAGLSQQGAGPLALAAGGPNLFDAVQAGSPTDATTFAHAVKSFAIGQTTMAQVQQRVGKPMMANTSAEGTAWTYTLADKTKAPDYAFADPRTGRSAQVYTPGGSGFFFFDSNGILRGVQVMKFSMDGGVSTTETVYSRGRLGVGG